MSIIVRNDCNRTFLNKAAYMILNDRQAEILDFLKENGRASVRRLAGTFYVSEMTIRRDLKEMERDGHVKRYSGGAIYCDDEGFLPAEIRRSLHSKEKSLIARQAEKYLRDDITIYIDSSSTCLYVIPLLAGYKNVRIVTNSVQCVLIAAKYRIPCTLAGGRYYEHDMCTVGSVTESFLRDINVDLCFFSSLGLSDDGVITDNDADQTAVRKAVMANAARVVILISGNKLHSKYLYTLCRAEDVADIICV